MYRAKSLGKARCEIFDAEMRASVTKRLQLETDLRYGVAREEFRNFYQPIISLESGTIVGFEALLRWQHPIRGLVGPDEFIPVVEEMGSDPELGWSGLAQVCGQLANRRLVCIRGSDDECKTIISSIMPLAQNLGMDVVVEGVETQEQLVFLKEVDCKFAQGFYFSKPMPVEEVEKLLLNVANRPNTLLGVAVEVGEIERAIVELANA